MKQRTSIPKHVAEAVLREYRHKCAICGRHNPQLHHLDENPANNEPLNLLPLCPNCHLQDTHDPTSPPDARKLKLFRAYKDPSILDPRFHPIFTRMVFLSDLELRKIRPNLYTYRANQLLDFIEGFQMGTTYRKEILQLLNKPTVQYKAELIARAKDTDPDPATIDEDTAFKEAAWNYATQRTEALIVELLRYQNWRLQRSEFRLDDEK